MRAKEGNVPLKATHLKAVPGNQADAPAGSAMELDGLFREYHDRVFRAAYRITGSVVDAEDVLQTVFLRLSRRSGGLGSVDLEPSPGSYLHRAAINAALDLTRQRGRTESIPIDDLTISLMANSKQNPESERANRELRGVIRQALSKLGERSAEMFVLKYFEGYDNGEIAELMGTSPMVVGVLLHRARTRVKKEIGDFLEEGK
jgi:RNA polymerase sigma-70 factor (ECF subfamily)